MSSVISLYSKILPLSPGSFPNVRNIWNASSCHSTVQYCEEACLDFLAGLIYNQNGPAREKSNNRMVWPAFSRSGLAVSTLRKPRGYAQDLGNEMKLCGVFSVGLTYRVFSKKGRRGIVQIISRKFQKSPKKGGGNEPQPTSSHHPAALSGAWRPAAPLGGWLILGLARAAGSCDRVANHPKKRRFRRRYPNHWLADGR